MSYTKTQIALVDGAYAGIKAIDGLSFRIIVVTHGRDISGMESEKRIADLERLVHVWNLLSNSESAAINAIAQARGEA